VAANIQGSGPAPVQEPSQLERLDGLMTQVESFPAAGFDIGKQLLQGAVVGDFNENPTIWNTIGQVAIGFVPYAGQVADIRDIVANVIQLRRSGYRDPDAWINLGLSCIGIIPGVGDIIKAVGRGSRGVIRSALSGVLRNADGVLRPVLGRAGGILRGARRYGSQFVGWASQQGARLRQSVTGFAQRAVNFARSAGQRAHSLVSAVRARVGQLLNGAVQRAQSITNQAQGLLGRVMSQFMAMAQRAFSAVQSRVSQAVSSVRRLVERGRELASRVAQRVAQVTRRAATLVREFTQSAIQKGQQAVQNARQWSSQQIKKATELGSRLVTQARKRVADLVRNGVKLAKEKAIPFIKQKLGGVKQRIKKFLQDRWEKLKKSLKEGVDNLKKKPLIGKLEKVGLPRDYLNRLQLNELQDLEKALNRWNLDASGKNQGVTHILDYAAGTGGAGKTNRLQKLEEYTGTGPFDINDPSVIPKVTNTLDNLVANTPTFKTLGGKTIYFVAKGGAAPPFSNSQKGIVIIKFSNSYSTFFNTDYKSFMKMQ
jgi:hypothetical protein